MYYPSEHNSINVKANIASNNLLHKIKGTDLKKILQVLLSVYGRFLLF